MTTFLADFSILRDFQRCSCHRCGCWRHYI